LLVSADGEQQGPKTYHPVGKSGCLCAKREKIVNIYLEQICGPARDGASQAVRKSVQLFVYNSGNAYVSTQGTDCCGITKSQSSPPQKSTTTLIETAEQLASLEQSAPFATVQSELPGGSLEKGKHQVVAIDCEGVPEHLYLVQVGTEHSTYIFDCVKFGEKRVCEFLVPLLKNESITKLFHDLHKDAAAFANLGGICEFRGTFDTQLVAELWSGNFATGFSKMLEQVGMEPHPTKHSTKKRMEGGQLFAQRPLPADVSNYAIDDVKLLVSAQDKIRRKLGGSEESWHQVQRASDTRANKACETGGERQICFDLANSYSIASAELLSETRPDDILVVDPLVVSNETSTLLEMLPVDLAEKLEDVTERLSDIVLDKGRTPLAWVSGRRMFLGGPDRLVEKDEIQSIVYQLGGLDLTTELVWNAFCIECRQFEIARPRSLA